MLYRTPFPRDMFAEFDRLQRDLRQALEFSPAIRGVARGGFASLNVSTSPTSVDVVAFAPGLQADAIEVNLDRGVLTIAGERKGLATAGDDNTTLHIHERAEGRFRRVVNLPDDVDTQGVSADYRDGVLHVSIKRREPVQPRRISVQ